MSTINLWFTYTSGVDSIACFAIDQNGMYLNTETLAVEEFTQANYANYLIAFIETDAPQRYKAELPIPLILPEYFSIIVINTATDFRPQIGNGVVSAQDFPQLET